MPPSANPSPAEIVAALQRGGIVRALQLVLAARGTGSRTTTRAAGHVAAPPKPVGPSPFSGTRSDLSPGEVPRSSGDIWLLLLFVAALCMIYYFFGR